MQMNANEAQMIGGPSHTTGLIKQTA